MALIVIAADKGAPGVTTTALALAAVWPRPVLLAECDPSGGDLVYRFPAAQGGPLDPRRGLVTLAVAARRGLQPGQLWEHTQKIVGGLDVLTGVINAEQGAGLATLWGPLGGLFAGITARYLALVATTLPGDSADDIVARDTARTIVLTSAKSAWDYRQTVDGLPLFGSFWDRDAVVPGTGGQEARFVAGAVESSAVAERDLSVQLSGWMLMEAAHSVTAAA